MTTFTNHQKLLAIALEEARSGLAQNGVNVIDLNSTECIDMMANFISTHNELWNEDIGES